MISKKSSITIGLSTLLTIAASARTWTSADGAKTFEADFLSNKGEEVTVLKNGRNVTFTLDKLSEADVAWVAKEAEKKAAEAASKAAVEAFAESDFGKAFKKLQKLEGKRLKKYSMETIPEYFILYLSASW